MIFNPPLSILFLTEAEDVTLTSFISYLRSIPHIRLSEIPQLPHDLSSYDIVITSNTRQSDAAIDRLTRFVQAGGGQLVGAPITTNFGGSAGSGRTGRRIARTL